MAYPHQYNQYVEEMLEQLERSFDQYEGFDPHPNQGTATLSSMLSFAQCTDPWNPLFNDPEYAKNTKWGSLIAFPNYADTIGTITLQPQIDPRAGFAVNAFPGENWKFYKPIRPGDTFRVFRRRGRYEDITRPDGSGPHMFAMVYSDCDIINQHGEVVCSWEALKNTIIKEKEGPGNNTLNAAPYTDHVYTPGELRFLREIMDREEIRGAVPRFWEDVKVGDELPAVTYGPNSIWNYVAFNSGRQEMPGYCTRRLQEFMPPMVVEDPKTHVMHTRIEVHLNDEFVSRIGSPRAINFGAAGMANMARVVTNWMGDDGELRTFKWRHLHTTCAGDAAVGRGRVLDKFVENGEHLAKLDLWLDNICRGNVTESACVTVKLPTREEA